MLTESRKRRRCCESEADQQLTPQAKRTGGAPRLVSHPGGDLWDSEQSSSSDCSSGGISSPETGAGASASLYTHNSQDNYVSHNSLSPRREDSPGSSLLRQQGFHDDGSGGCNNGSSGSGSIVSYDHINRVLREAHFSSLQTKGRPGAT